MNYSNEAIRKKNLVGILALKEVDELEDVLIFLESAGETELCKAIAKCAGIKYQVPAATSKPPPVQAGAPMLRPFAAVTPPFAVVAEAATPDVFQEVDFEDWKNLLDDMTQILIQTVNMQSLLVDALRATRVLTDIEAGQIVSW